MLRLSLAAALSFGLVTVACTTGTDESTEPAPASVSTTSLAPTTSIVTTTTSTTTSTTSTTTTTTVPPDIVAIENVLSRLDDRSLAQQLVIFGAAGSVSDGLLNAVGSVCVGGVFVTDSSQNWSPISSPDAARSAITELRRAADACAVAPFVATDAEPGTQVLRVPVTPLPGATTLEANHMAEPGTTTVGLAPSAQAFAAELSDLGVDVNFGVVADVDVGDRFYMARQNRSFGADPDVVGAITAALVEGHCAAGVAPTLKHFPNQGSTPEDPHLADSFSANSPEEWRNFGAMPYEATSAPLVMVGHIRYPDVDDGVSAVFSSTIVSGWLRQDLGYRGVVVTDDLLAMRGVGADLGVPERALAALRAGADLALFVDARGGEATIDAIVAAMVNDPAFASTVRASAERILRLKGALGLLPEADPAWFALCDPGR